MNHSIRHNFLKVFINKFFSGFCRAKIMTRRTKPPVFYWDMKILGSYWNCFGGPRPYHHTISSNLLCGLREALSQLVEEGLEASWARHKSVCMRFHNGLRRLSLQFFVSDPKYRLNTLTSIVVPQGVNFLEIQRTVMERWIFTLHKEKIFFVAL